MQDYDVDQEMDPYGSLGWESGMLNSRPEPLYSFRRLEQSRLYEQDQNGMIITIIEFENENERNQYVQENYFILDPFIPAYLIREQQREGCRRHQVRQGQRRRRMQQ